MTNDELEFLISQRLDGTLNAADAASLDRALATNPLAADLFASYAKLDHALKSSRRTMDLDAHALTARIAACIDDEPARTLKFPPIMWSGSLAAVAVLAIGLTVGVVLMRDGGKQSSPAAAMHPIARIDLAGPPAEPAASGGYAAVSVGVPANLTPSVVSALFLSDASIVGRVVIRPAGQRAAGGLE